MKTISINRNLSIIAVLFFVLIISSKLSAQAPNCTYTVSNPGNCAINITITFYDNLNTAGTPTTQGITSATSYTFSCGSLSQPLANVLIMLNTVNGNPLTAASLGYVDINNVTDSGGITGAGCSGQTSYNMNWNNAETVIQ